MNYKTNKIFRLCFFIGSDTLFETVSIFQTDFEATVNVEIEGEGSVTGTGDYHIGDTAVLRAVPDAGHSFVGWDDGVTDAERTIVVEDSVWLTATFV